MGTRTVYTKVYILYSHRNMEVVFISVVPQHITHSNCGCLMQTTPIDYNTQRAWTSVPANEAMMSGALFRLCVTTKKLLVAKSLCLT